ncbi:MAG: sialidase family protein [Limisphaerales bacterium]
MKNSTRLLLALLASASTAAFAAGSAPGFRIQLDTISRGYDGKTCWVHPRAGAIPGAVPSVVLTMQKLMLTGSDVFFALNEMRTDDLGKTWRGPTEHGETLGRRTEPGGVIVAACDFWPKWHAKSGRLLGIGHTVHYRDEKAIANHQRDTAWSVYDARRHTWTPWKTLAMPPDAKFFNAGAGCVQRVDLPDGDILLPVYYGAKDQPSRVAVLRCAFDGTTLRYVEQGNELAVDIARGLHEPSLASFGGRYFLTIRQDNTGYVTGSRDGLHFGPLQEWLWDDGTSLGSYNTQTHWVTHTDGLFLVYTRRGANNDHVFRHRAPLFIAQVDPRKLRVLRSTERVLVPERGARLGNFGVTEVSENETWVTVAEWMQTWGPNYVMPPDNKYGADNSVYAARILWDKPNRDWNRR